jgi:protein-L-isoaspartate(D-aspartate) O-methyltransferase
MADDDKFYKFYKNLDRALFIDSEYKEYAQCDSPLPIGFDQTISQPSLVYSMTKQLGLDRQKKVLEIGTGSGYQTALLAEFSGSVHTVERIAELSIKAKERLDRLGYKNIYYRIGDGSQGWPEFMPYDRIMVTAAAGEIPEPLIGQLALNGRMIIPVGQRGFQQLLLVAKDNIGVIRTDSLFGVTFVELIGDYGWKG